MAVTKHTSSPSASPGPALSPKASAWVRNNRGVTSKVAKAAKVTPQFVHLVLAGKRKSKDGKVERELRKHGAPV